MSGTFYEMQMHDNANADPADTRPEPTGLVLETTKERATAVEIVEGFFGEDFDKVRGKWSADWLIVEIVRALEAARDDEAGKIEAWLREADSVETTRNGHTFRQGLSYSERIAIVEFIATKSYRQTRAYRREG